MAPRRLQHPSRSGRRCQCSPEAGRPTSRHQLLVLMKQPALRAALAMLLAISGSGLLCGAVDRPARCASNLPAQAQSQLVQAQNNFGFTLLRELLRARSKSPKNAFISPFSIEQALGVVYLGARGATADAFVKANIVAPVESGDFACASQNLRADLPNGDSGVSFDFANALWVRQGFPLNRGFTDEAATAFGA